MLRLVVATPRYPPLIGGIELHTHEVARRLAAWGTSVTVLTTDDNGRLPAVEHRDGVEIRRFRAWPSKHDLYLSQALFAEIRRGRWDLLHVQGFQTLVSPGAMLSARRARLPYVVTFHAGGHSSTLRVKLEPVREQALRPLLARAERLIVLTPYEAEYRSKQLRLPQERFAVIPNGSDLQDDGVAPVQRDGELIASVGRLERYKGHHRVIAALPDIARRRPGVRLWIGGSGPYEEELRRLANELGVSDRVEIRAIPVADRTQMARELSRVHVVVCLSDFESQGIAVLEALGRGCRVVVARARGLESLVDQGLAHGVPSDAEPSTVADAILEELAKPPPVEPPKLWTWDDCAAALSELYESVVHGPLQS
jgi:glycosyltransferase involved in cell wall biosynthesis